MSRLNALERVKDALRDTDYIALKNSEGIDCSEYGDWKANRQSLRDEINALMEMTDEEYIALYGNGEEEVQDE